MATAFSRLLPEAKCTRVEAGHTRIQIADLRGADGISDEFVSVFVVFGIGSATLRFCRDEQVAELPVGTPHLMEHLLIRENPDRARMLEEEYVATFNGVVFPDHTVFYARDAWIRDRKPAQFVVGLTRTLLELAIGAGLTPHDLSPLLDRTVADVHLEIAHHSNGGRTHHLALLRSLFHARGLAEDPLGTHASLAEITPAHIEHLLCAFRSNVTVIVVGSGISGEVAEAVVATVRQVLSGAPPQARVLPDHGPPEPPTAASRFVSLGRDDRSPAWFYAGIKLVPLGQLALHGDDLLRRASAALAVSTPAVSHRINYESYTVARAVTLYGRHPPGSLADRVTRWVFVSSLRERLLSTFQWYEKLDSFPGYAHRRMVRSALARPDCFEMCILADLLGGYTLADFIDASATVTIDDLHALRAEIEAVQSRQVAIVVF